MELTRFFLLLFVGALVAFAVVTSAIVVIGSWNDFQMSLLYSVAAIAGYSLLALWIASIYQIPKYKIGAVLGLFFCGIAFLLAILTNWYVITPSSGVVYGTRFSFFLVALAFALSALMLRIQRITPAISWVRTGTVALLALDVVLLNVSILGISSFGSISKGVWVTTIFALTGMFLVPVLCRLNKQPNRRATDRK